MVGFFYETKFKFGLDLFHKFQFIEITNLFRPKCACYHCNIRNIWPQDLHIKTLQAGFHHLSRLTGTFEEFELSIFVGEIELAKLLAEVNVLLRSMLVFLLKNFCSKKGLRVRIRNRYFDMNSDYKGNWFCVGSYPVWVGCFF